MTVLGAAIAAGLAQKVWPDVSHLPTPHSTTFTPSISADGKNIAINDIYTVSVFKGEGSVTHQVQLSECGS